MEEEDQEIVLNNQPIVDEGASEVTRQQPISEENIQENQQEFAEGDQVLERDDVEGGMQPPTG